PRGCRYASAGSLAPRGCRYASAMTLRVPSLADHAEINVLERGSGDGQSGDLAAEFARELLDECGRRLGLLGEPAARAVPAHHRRSLVAPAEHGGSVHLDEFAAD